MRRADTRDAERAKHDGFCAEIGVCGARDTRGTGGREFPMGLGPNGWCDLPLGHSGVWHSQDHKGLGGYAIVLDDRSGFFVPAGLCPVFLTTRGRP